jgi:hypothetical protein
MTRTITENHNTILAGIVELLKAARSTAARSVNSIMTAVYWGYWAAHRGVRAARAKPRRIWGTAHPAIVRRFDAPIRSRIWPSKPLANARLLPNIAGKKDSLDSVWRICNAS